MFTEMIYYKPKMNQTRGNYWCKSEKMGKSCSGISIKTSMECKRDGVIHSLVGEEEQHHEDLCENYTN